MTFTLLIYKRTHHMKLILAAAMPLFAGACAPLPELDMSSGFAAAADLPRVFHPAATGARFVFTVVGAG